MGTLSESLFASDKPTARTVEMPDGTKHTLYFRQLPAVEFRRFYNAENSTNEDTRVGSMAKLIAAGLCDENGKAALDYSRALKLNASATNAIFFAIMAVNGLGDKKADQESPEVSELKKT